MNKQSFNLNTDFLGGYSSIFIKVVMAIILIYGFILVINFFRDKFLKKKNMSSDPHISDLLTILNKLFYIAGYGFIIANIIQFALLQMSIEIGRKPFMSLRGDWDYLTFGVILIFIGIGFKIANKMILKQKEE